MITKIKRRFKMATIKRQRHEHKTKLLIQKMDATAQRLNELATKEAERINELKKRYNITIS